MSKGLGDNCEFSSYHPLVNFLYFALVVGITMFSLSPVFLAETFIMSWMYSFLLKGKSGIRFNLIISLTTLIIMAVINTFFTHNGETVLFYVNTNRITLEAFVFGIATAVMLISVIIWFGCFNVIMSSDKLIYLFGKVAPILGLTLSMIFRFIPLLQTRFKDISMGQKCMGRKGDTGFLGKARQLVKEISILIAWSLESSIESADSMEARGYGLKGRTSFHLFKFSRRDIVALIYILFFGAIVIAGVVKGRTSMYFYPKVVMPSLDMATSIISFCYLALIIMPIVIDIRGEIKWRQLA